MITQIASKSKSLLVYMLDKFATVWYPMLIRLFSERSSRPRKIKNNFTFPASARSVFAVKTSGEEEGEGQETAAGLY